MQYLRLNSKYMNTTYKHTSLQSFYHSMFGENISESGFSASKIFIYIVWKDVNVISVDPPHSEFEAWQTSNRTKTTIIHIYPQQVSF